MTETIQSLDIDFSRFAEMGNDVLPRLNALREKEPLYWSAANQCWIATSHDLVVEGFSGRLPLSARRSDRLPTFFPDPVERQAKIGYIMEIFPEFLINTDPPDHARLRKLLMAAFSKQVAESYRPFARQVVAEVMQGLEGRTEIDFVDEVARSITGRVILHVMGLPETHMPRMEYWAHTINAGLGGASLEMIGKANEVLEEMRDVFLEEIERHSDKGATDFITLLLAARDGKDRLTEAEIVAQLMLILIAGHDTTLNTMALSMATLAAMPAERAYMRDNPDRFEQCIMELMRVVAMSTSMARIVSEDFEWHGKPLRKGEFVFLMIAAANRDPAVFADPERIDFDRSQNGNMTFAPGRHFCIGHWFAKMMMSEVFPAFLDRYEGWDLLDDDLVFTGSTGFRGPVRLDMRLHERTPGQKAMA